MECADSTIASPPPAYTVLDATGDPPTYTPTYRTHPILRAFLSTASARIPFTPRRLEAAAVDTATTTAEPQERHHCPLRRPRLIVRSHLRAPPVVFRTSSYGELYAADWTASASVDPQRLRRINRRRDLEYRREALRESRSCEGAAMRLSEAWNSYFHDNNFRLGLLFIFMTILSGIVLTCAAVYLTVRAHEGSDGSQGGEETPSVPMTGIL